MLDKYYGIWDYVVAKSKKRICNKYVCLRAIGIFSTLLRPMVVIFFALMCTSKHYFGVYMIGQES